MSFKHYAIIITLLFSSYSAIYSYQEDDIIFGLGTGTHFFLQTDDTRKNDPRFNEKSVPTSLFRKFYIEYYLNSYLGIGIHTMDFSARRSYQNIENNSYLDQKWRALYQSFSVQLMPIHFSDQTSLGLITSIGVLNYYWEERSFDSSNLDNLYDRNSNTTGPAALFGSFFDYSNKIFGTRVGVNAFYTQLPELKAQRSREGKEDPIHNLNVDYHGINLYIDLHWKF